MTENACIFSGFPGRIQVCRLFYPDTDIGNGKRGFCMKIGIGKLLVRLFAVLLTFSVLLPVSFPLTLSAYNDSGSLIGETSPLSFPETVIGGLSAEVSGGTHIVEKNAGAVFSMPAEVALLVNALVAVEELGEERLDETVTVNMAEFPYVTDVGNLEIPNRARVTYRDLISLMLLCRSQDAAAILAVEIGNRFSSYLERMNYRASVLNMSGTYFTSVNGVFSPDQTTSFTDIAHLLEAVAANETLINILSQTSYTVSESATRLEKSYDSVLPASPVPGLVSVMFGSASENGTIYACIDRRDFTTCTAVLFQNQEITPVFSSVVELHNSIYERYAVSTLANVAAILAKSEKIRYYNEYRACYVQAVDYSNRVFTREALERIVSDEAYVRENFSFDYQRSYIYSESREPGMIVAVADLKYQSVSVCSAPLYVSDEVLPLEMPKQKSDFSFSRLFADYKNYILIAGAAFVVLILAVLLVVFRKRGGEETEDLDGEETQEDLGSEDGADSEKESPETAAEAEVPATEESSSKGSVPVQKSSGSGVEFAEQKTEPSDREAEPPASEVSATGKKRKNRKKKK